MSAKIQVRRDTAANWSSVNPTLLRGEIAFEYDTYKVKIGDGTLAWNDLPYALVSQSDAQDLIDAHADRTDNPHNVTKAQVGLGNVDNTSDANKPISTATQTALNSKADTSYVDTELATKADASSVYTKTESDTNFEPKNANIQSHISSTNNPHSVTKAQVGLGNVDNTSDVNKPISTATQTALNSKADTSYVDNQLATKADASSVYTKTESDTNFEPKNANIQSHISSTDNPHSVTKAQVGLGDVPNVDATLRANHTGTQLASTISDFSDAVNATTLLDPELRGGIYWAKNETDALVELGELISFASTMGITHGGQLTVSSGRVVNVAEMTGYTMSNTPYATHTLVFLEKTATTIEVPANGSYYVYYTGSGVLSTSNTLPSNRTNIILGRVITDADSILYIEKSELDAHHWANYVDRMFREAMGPIFATGGLVSENSTPLKLDVSSGVYFYSEHRLTLSSATQATWDAYYRDGASGSVKIAAQSTVPVSQYDNNSGTLVSIPTDKWVKHLLYAIKEQTGTQKFLLVYAQDYHDTQGQAESAPLPVSPSFVTNTFVKLASIVVKQGASSIGGIVDERPRLGFVSSSVAGSVSDHGDLVGLDDDDHPQYLLANGSRDLTGDLDFNGNSILNTGTVNGVAVEAHASRHLPNGLDPLSTGAPVTIGTSNSEGTANSFARSDHQHSHGNQSNGDLHAVATSSVNGFLSSSDKTKLDTVATGATANSSDSYLLNRANHTGTQLSSTISDFETAAKTALESEYGIANGLATLDSSGKVPVAQLPNSVMEYKGAYDPNTNTPSLSDGTGNAGDVYRISAAGDRDFGSGSITFFTGDFIIYSGTIWERSPLADGVVSVNGYQGAVVLTKSDIGLDNVPNVDATDRSNHTGTQLAATISDFTSAVQAVTIDAAKIDGGVVSNAEFATLDGIATGVTIQSQLNTKEPSITNGTTDQYWRGDKSFQTLNAAAVANTPSGNIAATTVQAALNELDTEKQATITGAATTITSSNLTASRALASDASGKVAVSAVTSTELGYVSGVTSAIQTQIDGKRGYLGIQTLTGGTTYTPTAGTTYIEATLVGAGGGGGGVTGTANNIGAGAGGGSGAILIVSTALTGAASYTYAIGAAGTAGAGTPTATAGGAGGNTTLTIGAITYTANGGSGGAAQTAGTAFGLTLGGAGGTTPTGGSINVPGTSGSNGFRSSGTVGFSGAGANSIYGAGGAAPITAAVGGAGAGHGAGGAGGFSTANQARAGGAGSAGVIIIREYK